MKLFEISDEIERVMAQAVDHETGEMAEEAAQLLDDLQLDLEQKALAVAKYAMGERAEAEAIRAQAQKMERRAEVHERHATWLLETYLGGHLQRNDMGPREPQKAGRETILKDLEVEIAFTKSASAVSTGTPLPTTGIPTGTPDGFIKRKTLWGVDKAGIRKALLAGEKVQGWRLDWKSSLKVR